VLSLSSSNKIDQDEILRLVELRVVRECNLPDNYTNFLRKMRGKQTERLCANPSSNIHTGVSEYHVRDDRRSSSFSSGIPGTGTVLTVPDVTLATTTSITSAFSTLSTNLTSCGGGLSQSLTSGGERGAAAVTETMFDQDSPDLVAVDTTHTRTSQSGSTSGGGGAECSDYSAHAGSSAIKTVRNTWANMAGCSKIFKQAPPVDVGWNHSPASAARTSSDQLHSLYHHQQKHESSQLYSSHNAAPQCRTGGSNAGSRNNTPSGRRHLQLMPRQFAQGLNQDNLHM